MLDIQQPVIDEDAGGEVVGLEPGGVGEALRLGYRYCLI